MTCDHLDIASRDRRGASFRRQRASLDGADFGSADEPASARYVMVRKANHMTKYARMYRFGITPWERYGTAAATSIATLLDREENERSRPLGRALDLGCGRGQYTPDLARRGWQAVGIDNVPAAIEAAKRKGTSGATYVVGDVTGPAGGRSGRVRLLPRRRLLPGSQCRAA